MKDFTDKVVVITGAGSGIGRALALNFAGRGAQLALSDVNDDGLAETVDQVKNLTSRRVRSDHLDVADRDAFGEYAATIASDFGRVNLVVNNAGVSLSGAFWELEWKDIDWIMGINFWGVVHGSRFFLPHLIASGDGHLVNISSLFGLVSMPSQSMYNAAKYGVRGMSESIREDLLVAGLPVGVTVVHPGGIKTGIARNGRFAAGIDGTESAKNFDEKMAKMTPEKAAEIIINGVINDKARVLVGLDAHIIHNMGKYMGSHFQDFIAGRVVKGGDIL